MRLSTALMAAACGACMQATAADHRFAFDGQCALGWAHGHRVMTDCSVAWQEPASGEVYCFSGEAARERFLAALADHLARARANHAAAGR